MSASAQRMPEWLRQRALISPHRLALMCGERRWTFAELDRRTSALAARLRSMVEPGERVALLAGNSPAFVEAVHAAPRAGAVLVPLNARLTAAELSHQVDGRQPALLLHDDANGEKAAAVAKERSGLRCIPLADLAADMGETSADVGPETVDLSTVHTVIYTSGTGGSPKGAMLTFGNHWWSAVGSALNLGLHGDDRWLACLPLFHVGGLAILMRSVIYGIPVVLHERFDAQAVNRSIDEDGATIVSVVPTMLQRMLEARAGRPYPPTLRCVLVGGGPVPRSLLEECARSGAPAVQTYGLTEAASQVTTLSPDDALRKVGSAGKPLFSTEVRIVGEDGDVLSAGEVGEIAVRGPTVTVGYVESGGETATDLRDGWLRTGDAGYLDDEGYLFVVDRRDDLIVTGGENVYPAEVEAVLCSHPAVADAGVAGLPDERWGQRVAAAVVLRDGTHVREGELLAFCRERLAGYKAPKEMRFVGGLPRNAAGKLVRRDLRGALTGPRGA